MTWRTSSDREPRDDPHAFGGGAGGSDGVALVRGAEPGAEDGFEICNVARSTGGRSEISPRPSPSSEAQSSSIIVWIWGSRAVEIESKKETIAEREYCGQRS